MTHLYLNVSLFSMRNFYLFIYFLILCYRRLVAWLGSFSHGHKGTWLLAFLEGNFSITFNATKEETLIQYG